MRQKKVFPSSIRNFVTTPKPGMCLFTLVIRKNAHNWRNYFTFTFFYKRISMDCNVYISMMKYKISFPEVWKKSPAQEITKSSSWIHRPQIRIISSWPRKPKRHEVENHEMVKHEHSHLQYCICNSSFNNKTICSFCNAQSFCICPHQNTQRICERKKLLIICTELHSLKSDMFSWWCFT